MRWDGWPILGQVFGNLSDLQDLGSECFMRCVCVCVCVCVRVGVFVCVCVYYVHIQRSFSSHIVNLYNVFVWGP